LAFICGILGLLCFFGGYVSYNDPAFYFGRLGAFFFAICAGVCGIIGVWTPKRAYAIVGLLVGILLLLGLSTSPAIF
jgi:hypothetical protein